MRPSRWSTVSRARSVRSRVVTQEYCAQAALPCNNATRLRAAAARLGRPRRKAAMNTPQRLEHQMTDKGFVPVYANGVVEQPWSAYTDTDHEVWAVLFARQREILQGRASTAFLQAQDAMGMSPLQIPKFDDLNRVMRAATGWEIVGVEGLLDELTFFDHLANRRFPITWWIRKPEQLDYLSEP